MLLRKVFAIIADNVLLFEHETAKKVELTHWTQGSFPIKNIHKNTSIQCIGMISEEVLKKMK